MKGTWDVFLLYEANSPAGPSIIQSFLNTLEVQKTAEIPERQSNGGFCDLRSAGLRFGVFIKKTLFQVLQHHQNTVFQIGVRVRFVCESASSWLRPLTGLCVS